MSREPISYQVLSGETSQPVERALDNFTIESFMGNNKLWILTLLTYILPLAASTVIVVVLVIAFICYRRNRKEMVVTQPNDLSVGIEPCHISYYEVLDATKNFDEENLLGRGSFGSVYKGTLRNGMMIAVKVFDLQDENALRSLDTECEVMRNIRHRNLVKIITVCSNLDLRALVLEYMCNGSLDMILHQSHGCDLNLHQRMEIAMDVALAMEYLHHGYTEAIVHFDLKLSNILLDKNMVARVSDYNSNEDSCDYRLHCSR